MIIDCAIDLHVNFFRLDKIEVFSSFFPYNIYGFGLPH